MAEVLDGSAPRASAEVSAAFGRAAGGAERPLTILHVITSLARGGAQAHLLELIRGQKQRGHAVHLAFFKDPDMVEDFFPLVGFPMDLAMASTASAAVMGRLWGLVSAIKPDVLHTHLLKADAYGAVAGRFGKAGVTIASKHNDEEALRRPWVARLHGLLSRLDDRIIVLSDYVGRYVVEAGHVLPAKVRLVYYGIRLDRPLALSTGQAREARREFGFPPDGPLLLSVGRLDPQKDHPTLIAAMGKVVRRVPEARLLIVGGRQLGDAAYERELHYQAERPEVAGKVVFAGERKDVPRLMAACDVFTLASRWEGFGLVFVEAMAASKPVVATRVSAIPEVVENGVTGLLVPPRDPDALAEALIRLCEDPAERRRLGSNGYHRVRQRFTADRMVEETLAVYHEALAERGSAKRTASKGAGASS